ncbi:hypothetical protein GZH47_33225 (plasmid) [Paenibacillus rhizovicinus]|uniref:Uncharacterized protein n=1 Tax=Paenibacillus rhizovicinus TaxID=2704463 RepID=A0A6C0PB39_9BACL|nr:hypothetical protein [Paenibacillus rhizovicinus]QHW35757.1 hypothetical protein GZH47_33225 [Paenibacillus rhizovicinus]
MARSFTVYGFFTFKVNQTPHAEDIALNLNSILSQIPTGNTKPVVIPCYLDNSDREAIVVADHAISEDLAAEIVEKSGQDFTYTSFVHLIQNTAC